MKSPRVKLGELCHIVTKGTTPTSIGYSFSESGVPFLRIQNINNQTVDLSNVLYVSGETNRALKRSRIQPKDFLITIAGTVGKVAIVPDEFPECNCNQAIAILRFDRNRLDPHYLLRWLGTNDALGQISGKKVTATISNLSLGQIKELQIPLPPIQEQQQIAAILDAADSLRQKDQQLIDHYTALSQSLFLDMFGDPVLNTMNWDAVKLGEICGVGSSKRVFSKDFVDSGVPFYRGTEVGSLGGSKEITPHLFISSQHYEELKESSGIPKVGDLLMPSICHDGRIWRVDNDKPFYFKDGRVLWVKVNNEVLNSEYLRKLMSSLFLANYSEIASGSTFAELKIVALKGLSILKPPIELQNEFAKRVSVVDKQKQQAQASLEKSEALFNSLLQRAFNGELTSSKTKAA